MELKNTHNYRMWLLTVTEANNPSPCNPAELRTAQQTPPLSPDRQTASKPGETPL